MAVEATKFEITTPAVGNVLTQDELTDEFEFKLDGHEPVEPVTERGEVADIRLVEPVSLKGAELPGVTVYEVRVKDPYLAADPVGYELVNAHANRQEDYLLAAESIYDLGDFSRKEAGKSARYNRYTQALVGGRNAEGVKLWREHVPTAIALEYLLHPKIGRQITGKESEDTHIISPESAMQMRFVDDAVAIRERGVAMQEIAETHLHKISAERTVVEWLSLASGTAEPSIAAAKAAELNSGVEVDLTVTDMDGTALDYVEAKAKDYGFDTENNLHKVQTNILLPDLPDELAIVNGNRQHQYDVVENMGFKEYLPEPGDELAARNRIGLIQASEFTRRAFELVKPGGILISGNMVLPPDMSSTDVIRQNRVRPQLHYVFGVVDWPLINARSEEQILNIYHKAGIGLDQSSSIELFRVVDDMTGLHIYDIVKVTKH